MATYRSELTSILEKNGVVPDVMDGMSDCESAHLFITYFKAGIPPVIIGSTLTPKQTHSAPQVTWEAKAGKFYSLVMTDPDAPSRADPSMREFVHWVVGNCTQGDVASGETLATYVGCGPPVDTGLHRYIFVLYEHDQPADYSSFDRLGNAFDGRIGWKLRDFESKFNLGKAIGVTFYEAEFDEWSNKILDPQ